MLKLLEGIRVLECALLPSGDHVGQMMGDLGADVIKIERPGTGDYMRDLGGTIVPHHSPMHLLVNRNKRSMTLDLRSDEGKRVFFQLLSTADIFVDGFAGDACTRLGIGYEEQRKAKPAIIYCQSSGYGFRGPYGQIPVHGYMMGDLAGTTTLERGSDGLVREIAPSDELYFPGHLDGPYLGAIFAVIAATSALNYLRKTGEGVYIDASGSDAALACQAVDVTREWNFARLTDDTKSPPTRGTDPRDRPKHGYYATLDGRFVMFSAVEPKFWENFCLAIDRPDLCELKDDAVICDWRDEDGSQAGLADELQSVFGTRTLAEWVDAARRFDFPLGPANQRKDILEDPQFRAREIIEESHHPIAGPFTTIGWPAPVSGQPFETTKPAPTLGQHTDEVLEELGFTRLQIEDMRETGVV